MDPDASAGWKYVEYHIIIMSTTGSIFTYGQSTKKVSVMVIILTADRRSH
jgi:hypothetical protein